MKTCLYEKVEVVLCDFGFESCALMRRCTELQNAAADVCHHGTEDLAVFSKNMFKLYKTFSRIFLHVEQKMFY